MPDVATVARALRAGEICREHGITQAQIAEAVGASQSQVSRILSGQGIRQSRLMEEVCLYVERFSVGVTADAVRENAELVEAIQAAWDGSASHAKALSTVIRSLAVLRTIPEAEGKRSSKAQT
jgi:transcriptional regulator with XRE-family HTH domain